jgi:site-specific DNA-methyltransferase (adenine-specific)
MANLAKSVLEADGEKIGYFWHGEVGQVEVPPASLYITDPPYNIGINYGGGVNDRLDDAEYHNMLRRVLSKCYDDAADDAHLFFIHYPEKIAEMWGLLTEKWECRQWISWVYPTNTGHSPSQWTTAHRTIIWLTKGDPYFHPRGVTQRFKNPSAKVVKEKVRQGVKGVALYNWWEITQVKNISKENREYENQIPSELIRRIILCASRPEDWVADPFAGTFSTASTALGLGRRAWGCDINPEVCRYWPEKSEWRPREDDEEEGHVDEGEHDDVLVHITQDQLDRALQRLLGEATEEQLTRVIGRVNGPRVFTLLNENSSEG